MNTRRNSTNKHYHIKNANVGLQEAILDDVKKQGIEIGREEGREKGREEMAKEFVLSLWHLQEMSFDKIASVVNEEPETILDIIKAHLTEQGETEERAQLLLDEYQAKFILE
jgi:flagellar biosynthesis/type III secretory pathway protein FliH